MESGKRDPEDTVSASQGDQGRKMGRPKTGIVSTGSYCVAVGCSNCQGREGKKGVKFYTFPKDEARRQQWIVRVNRREPSGALWQPKSSARLCSEHFFGGEKSNDPDSVSYLPSIFPTVHVREPRQTDLGSNSIN